MKTPHAFGAFLASALALLLAAPGVRAECSAACPSEYLPVCGDNGALYSNQCFLDYDACRRPGVVSPIATGNLDCETVPSPPLGEEPIGDTAGFDDPISGWVWPIDNEPSEGSSSSSSSSSGDGDGDGDDEPEYVLPPNVVIDDNAPSASDFALVVNGGDEAKGGDEGDGDGDGDGEGAIGGTADVVDGFFESAEWEGGGDSSANSSSGDSDDGSGNGDGDGDGDGDGNHLCEIVCLDRYDPVCATNNATFSNRCYLALAQCKDPRVEPAYMGECALAPPPAPIPTPIDPCAYNCPMWDFPVCSEDGHIYTNMCTFGSARCRDPTLGEATAELCKRKQ
ncbi:hypothetical protein PybrP1_000639 [[Pythium] brassicae (nom. inval.)]|nr:hypothetical protein PybrP1_000639 [[Pythium] brassicae (nom. inval.)]